MYEVRRGGVPRTRDNRRNTVALSEYDRSNLDGILNGRGDWFGARLLRALNALLPYADDANTARMKAAWPEETAALVAHFNRKDW